MRQMIRRLLPRPFLPLAHRLHYLPVDTFERVTGRRDAMVPPRRLWFVGDGDFVKIGERFMGFFIEFGGLQPDHRVLDVGCGVGRMAIPLTLYLNREGSYEGFDAVDEAVQWCRSHITPRYPNFQFQTADVYNRQYNPKGRAEAETYRFPYPDDGFDFVIGTSVFTHLLPAAMERYVSETARVLKPGGRCFATFFLLNDESRRLIWEGRSRLDIRHLLAPGCRVLDPGLPERAVAYDEDDAAALFERSGLDVVPPLRYGRWCGRKDAPAFQDIVVLKKKGRCSP